MSPGVCRRSTAALPSEIAPGCAARRCMARPRNSLSPCGRGRGPRQRRGGVRGLADACGQKEQWSSVYEPPHPPIAAQWVPPSPARGEGQSCAPRPASSRLERRGDRGAVEAFAADDDEAGGARLALAPGAVEIMLEARADGLHHLAELLAGDVEEALEAEDVVRRDQHAQALDEALGIGDRAARHDEAL